MQRAVQSNSTSSCWRIGIAALAFMAFGWPLATADEAVPTKTPASAAEVPYGVGDWPESNGNHRAVVHVAQPAEIVQVRIPWRRRDEKPDAKDIFIVDAKTGRPVDNVLRVEVNREFGWLLFEPVTTPADNFVYYMPFRNAGRPVGIFPRSTKYLPPRRYRQAGVGQPLHAQAPSPSKRSCSREARPPTSRRPMWLRSKRSTISIASIRWKSSPPRRK